MKNIKKFYKEHRIFSILMAVVIVCVILLCTLLIQCFYTGNKDKYGDRLDDISKYEIKEEKLTEIESKIASQKDVEKAPTTYEALKRLSDWIPEDSTLVTWSENDARQLDDELYFKDICLNKLYDFLDDYIDCQEIFSEKMETNRVYQLSEALAIANIDYDENIHNAHAERKNEY